ncbi:MAG: TIGR03619 family F420-dependent LLM class oxidoreductase [Candidatus Nitrosocosmicus sp.]|nr:TIGR03619 family F420-dependent LLM class oxidoreductase [Candidatus Nitrosocosmicus sp.]MDN5867641.1 TIGR03619 family F420-dependent LLM class oxidoreductase [Candidatus Nitrosocosmicus sp.]
MKLGIILPQAGNIANRENILRMAQSAEAVKIDSLWVFERLLWPIKPQTPYPATPDGYLPEEYQIMFDPLQTLGFVAAKTTKIQLGTSILDILFHNPVMLARSLATLDVLSEGSLIAGFGLGWMKDEYQASNIPFTNKGKRYDEFLQIIKKTWLDDVVEFKGAFYNIPDSKIGPKPVQKPHIPIYLGGYSPDTFSRTIECDTSGWLGILIDPIENIENIMNGIRERAKKLYKNPDNFKIILLTCPQIIENGRNNGNENRFPMCGTIDQIGSDIKRLRSIGIDHMIVGYSFSPMGKDVDRMLETTKQFLEFAK